MRACRNFSPQTRPRSSDQEYNRLRQEPPANTWPAEAEPMPPPAQTRQPTPARATSTQAHLQRQMRNRSNFPIKPAAEGAGTEGSKARWTTDAKPSPTHTSATLFPIELRNDYK